MLRLHGDMHPRPDALACFDMSQRLCYFRVRLLACFASLYLVSKSYWGQ